MTQHLVSQLGMLAWVVIFWALTALVITVLICLIACIIRFTVNWFKRPLGSIL